MRVLATKKSKKVDEQRKKNKDFLKSYFSLLYNQEYTDALVAKSNTEIK
jgi:hypothetical protein